ncbi:hypothetical protein ACFSHQ_04265 [Gemmobacter lanyuensis]
MQGDLFGADLWCRGGLLVRAIRAPMAPARFDLGDLAAWAQARGRPSLRPPIFPGAIVSASSRPMPISRRWPKDMCASGAKPWHLSPRQTTSPTPT